MIYTATDNGNFALVKGSAPLTSAHHSDRGIRAKLLAVEAQGPEVLPQHTKFDLPASIRTCRIAL
ncbi:hypothetical protein QFZ49_005601 [Streptomyces turgidiscabies]|uniref:Uncharacterized protein n=1 Tax=Streptomyces turgidiscabies TaxID=85558 RepID=A0ABU0RUG6_9ACTN|nr:hypothetical protein [Streptomyces turgidiscabies]